MITRKITRNLIQNSEFDDTVKINEPFTLRATDLPRLNPIILSYRKNDLSNSRKGGFDAEGPFVGHLILHKRYTNSIRNIPLEFWEIL